MEIFDTHAHYDDTAFDADRDMLLGETLPAAGVCGIVSCSTNIKSSKANAGLAAKYKYLYFAAGIHPRPPLRRHRPAAAAARALTMR